MPDSSRNKLTIVAAALLLVAFLGQGLGFLAANSQTFDEAVHLTAGYSYLATGDFRLNPEHPPLIKELSALPVFLWYHLPFRPDAESWRLAQQGRDEGQWRISQDFLYGSSVPADSILTLGRLPNLLLGTCLVALIGWWSFRLWGRGAALLGMSLAALEPNLVANGSLITTDIGITLFMFLTLYLTWEYCSRPSLRLLLATGLALGLALGSKFSSLLLLGIWGIVVVRHIFCGGSFAPLGRSTAGEQTLPRRLEDAVKPFLRIVCLGIVVVVALYFFQLDGLPTWTYGLRTQMNQQTTGKESFFLGEYSDGGWKSYFLVALLLKTPLGSLTLIALSLLLWRAGTPLGRKEVLFLVLPAAVYLLALTRLRLNTGVRYALPVYPFLFVLASRLATVSFHRAWIAPAILALPVAATAFSSLRVAPHQLAYFNEAAGGPAQGYHYLSNSNLDWGQDLRGLKEYLDRQGISGIYLSYYGTAPPAYYGIRHQYLPGYGQLDIPAPTSLFCKVLAISVVNLQGVHCEDKQLYGWLGERTPIAKIGYSIFVYDLQDDADAHLQLAKVYRQVGPHELVVPELRRVLDMDPGNAEALRLLQVTP